MLAFLSWKISEILEPSGMLLFQRAKRCQHMGCCQHMRCCQHMGCQHMWRCTVFENWRWIIYKGRIFSILFSYAMIFWWVVARNFVGFCALSPTCARSSGGKSTWVFIFQNWRKIRPSLAHSKPPRVFRGQLGQFGILTVFCLNMFIEPNFTIGIFYHNFL